MTAAVSAAETGVSALAYGGSLRRTGRRIGLIGSILGSGQVLKSGMCLVRELLGVVNGAVTSVMGGGLSSLSKLTNVIQLLVFDSKKID